MAASDSSSGRRIEWVDVAKGIGIFLVVFGHNLGGLRESGILKNSWAEHYIYVFHMPLFFFLAGIFVNRSANRSFRDYLMNKASVIVYPYFLWSILEVSIQIFASRYTNNHLSIVDLIKLTYQPIDQYWFLYAIFLMYIAYWWVRNAKISANIFVTIALLLYVVDTFAIINVPWDVFHAVCAFLIYFALGVKAAETSFFTDLNALDAVRLSGLAIGGFVLIAAAVAVNSSGLPFLHVVLALTGTVATISLAMLLCESPMASLLRIPGFYSLEIYVGHTVFASGARIAMQKVFGYSGPLLHLVVGTALGMMIPILLAVWGPKVGLPYLFTWSRSRRDMETSAIKLPAG